MGEIYNFFEKLTGKVTLEKKPNIFGSKKIILIISANLKILKIIKNNDLKFPFKENTIIDLEQLKDWSITNNFSIHFSTKNSSLKRYFYFEFESISDYGSTPKKKYINKGFKNTNNKNYTFFQIFI